jgi:hypothetical protein
MTLRLTFAVLALLSQTGCVAAIPLATQLISGTNSAAQLCSMAKLPGQTQSLCDSLPFGAAAQAVQPAQIASRGATVNTAAK